MKDYWRDSARDWLRVMQRVERGERRRYRVERLMLCLLWEVGGGGLLVRKYLCCLGLDRGRVVEMLVDR